MRFKQTLVEFILLLSPYAYAKNKSDMPRKYHKKRIFVACLLSRPNHPTHRL